MRAEVRRQGVKALRARAKAPAAAHAVELEAARLLLQVYGELAQRGRHLFGDLVGPAPPVQWEHYPADDAVDPTNGYQWFYHSHPPEDRPDSQEHGHIHVFARRSLWEHMLDSPADASLVAAQRETARSANTSHLLSIGFDGKGLPTSLFMVGGSVTGDLVLSAASTVHLIDGMRLETGYSDIDAVVFAVIRLYDPELRGLVRERDAQIAELKEESNTREILSFAAIDLDARVREVVCV